LDLRDKYLSLSNQRLGDNPRDHDGTFRGFNPPTSGDIPGLKPNIDNTTCEHFDENDKPPLEAWKIYPPPPPPHWKWKPAEGGPKLEGSGEAGGNEDHDGSGSGSGSGSGARPNMETFKFEECEIPGEWSVKCDFGLNDEGVYEVWERQNDTSSPSSASSSGMDKGKKPFARVPSLKEYFTDLDYLLGVCSDGPAKSFAFRRLKYLASKWSLYCLLNEYQELADMKVGQSCSCDLYIC
jgi:AMP deaminase